MGRRAEARMCSGCVFRYCNTPGYNFQEKSISLWYITLNSDKRNVDNHNKFYWSRQHTLHFPGEQARPFTRIKCVIFKTQNACICRICEISRFVQVAVIFTQKLNVGIFILPVCREKTGSIKTFNCYIRITMTYTNIETTHIQNICAFYFQF